MSVIDTSFVDCVAFNSEGAALFAERVTADATIRIEGSSFTRCQTTFGSGAGGVLRCREIESGAALIIENSLFKDNSARAGGAQLVLEHQPPHQGLSEMT